MLETNLNLFLCIFGIIGLLFVSFRPLYEWREQRRYARERRRFTKEVAEGKSPDWCPRTTSFDGAISISSSDLIHTKSFKIQIKKFAKIKIAPTSQP